MKLLNRNFQIKWNIFKRNKYMWFYLLFNYIFLALIDKKGHIFLENNFLYAYRFISQQLYIVFTLIFFINIFINEKFMKIIKNFMIIYIEEIRKELRTIIIFSIFINILMFLFGQIFLGTVNFIYFSSIPLHFLIANFLAISIEIITMIFLITGIRLLFRKSIFVYSIYYVYILLSLSINNIWITTPLTIKLLEEIMREYHYNFGIKLWLSRILLLLIAVFIYLLGKKKFIKNLN